MLIKGTNIGKQTKEDMRNFSRNWKLINWKDDKQKDDKKEEKNDKEK